MHHPGGPEKRDSSSDTALQQEQQRIARIRSGDADAFRDLYMEHYPSLLVFVTGLLGSRGAAEDVIQELFTELWEQRATWTPSRIAPYLFRAARHRAIDELRRTRRVERHVQSATDHIGDWTGQAPQGTDVEAETHDLERRLARAIAALPKRRRVALLLRVVQGMSYADIGETLNISEKAAFILVARAKEALQPVRDLFLQSDASNTSAG